jgi:hypothetical protein
MLTLTPVVDLRVLKHAAQFELADVAGSRGIGVWRFADGGMGPW